VVALKAAVDHRELRLPVARRTKLPATVIERCFVPGAPPADDAVAKQLVHRPLAAKTVRWVLRDAAERRPEVLWALLRTQRPGRSRAPLGAGHPDPDVSSAVLANPDWPIDEQLAVARRADGSTVLWWLASSIPRCRSRLRTCSTTSSAAASATTSLAAGATRCVASRRPSGDGPPGHAAPPMAG
jgi:hypothetical protein